MTKKQDAYSPEMLAAFMAALENVQEQKRQDDIKAFEEIFKAEPLDKQFRKVIEQKAKDKE